jgi:diacylglycerol diphosphate phosphatase/phosphatidate phosphatase
VTVPELAVYCLVIPSQCCGPARRLLCPSDAPRAVILILIFSLAVNRSVWDFHAALLGLVLTHALTITATTLIKVSVGRPRPDIIDRCQPREGAANAPVYGLVTETICTRDLSSHIMSEG